MTSNLIQPQKIGQAKKYSCIDILDFFGHSPILEKTNGELVYFSPFRNERTPSFYLNIKENVFYDHGDADRKGDAISLYRFLTGKSFQTAIYELTENKINVSKSSMVEYKPLKVKESGIDIISILPEVRNQNLLLFAENRGIYAGMLNQFCAEIKYTQKSTGRFYSSIAFKNDSQGFELRSAGFKAVYGKKDISTIVGTNTELLVFEGFFDFLSFCVMHPDLKGRTAIILNTLSNLKKVDYKAYTKVYHFLDNDKAGTAAKDKIKELHPDTADWSHLYTGFNDLNERLISNLDIK